MRRRARIEEGDLFYVYGERDTIVLKRIRPPRLEELEAVLAWGHRFAKRRGLTRRDIDRVLAAHRAGSG